MALTWQVILMVSLVGFLLGMARGGFVGLGPLLSPLLSLVLPSVTSAVGVMLPLLMVGDLFALYTFWREWDWAILRRTLPGALVGVVLGTFLLVNLPTNVLRASLGVFTWLIVAYRLISDWLQRWRYTEQVWHGPLAGGLSGLTSAMFNSGALPLNSYLLLQKIAARPFVATNVLFFAIINWLKLPGFLATSVLNLQLLFSLSWMVVFIPLGLWAARYLLKRLDQVMFERLVMAMLVFTGGLLIWQSL